MVTEEEFIINTYLWTMLIGPIIITLCIIIVLSIFELIFSKKPSNSQNIIITKFKSFKERNCPLIKWID